MTTPDQDAADQDRAVLAYLQALEAGRAGSGMLPGPDDAGPALAGADMVAGDDQEGLAAQLAESTPGSRAQADSLEDVFVRAAPGYARRHVITYEGWRPAGVAADVLARAGIDPPGGRASDSP